MSVSKKPADPALRPAQVGGVQEFCKPSGSGPWGRALKPLMNNLGVNNEELKRFPRTKSQNHCKCPNLPVPLKKALCSQWASFTKIIFKQNSNVTNLPGE